MVEKSQAPGLWPSLYEPFRQFGTRLSDWLSPPSDAAAGEDGYRITMELPGVEEKDIELKVDHGLVSIKGEKRIEREEKGDTWYFSERQFGSFNRAFRLPADADEDGVRAALKDGVLTVTVPRRKAAGGKGKPVKIERG